MKIQLFDSSHVINQIKRASPPKDKEAHKFLNNLAILLEKNTTKKSSTLEQALVTTTDKLSETFLDLCFKRKELAKNFSQEYLETANAALEKLRANKAVLEESSSGRIEPIAWDLKMDEANSAMPQIFSKLQKARTIIEEAIEKNECIPGSSNVNVDAFFSNV